jgi:hypothetical protein
MSRQMMRLRPPAEEDLQPTAEEEMQRRPQIAGGITKQTPTALQATHPTGSVPASQADHAQGADRSSYFVGRYAQATPVTSHVEHKKAETIVDGLLSEFSLPDSLRQCILHLINVMREHGIGAAQAALHNDDAIDRKHVQPILRLLAAVARDDLQTHL